MGETKLEAERNEFAKEKKQLEERIKELTRERDSNASEVTSYKERVANLEDEGHNREVKYSGEKRGLDSELVNATSEIANLKDKNEKLDQLVKSLTSDRDSKSSEIIEYEKRVANMKDEKSQQELKH